MTKIWDIKLYEKSSRHQFSRYRVEITNEMNMKVIGNGQTAMEAYKDAEIKLVIKPAFFTEIK